MSSLEEGSTISFRVVIIGDSSVGKTSIMKTYLHNSFDPKEQNTIGAFMDKFTIKTEYFNKNLEIQLWDTAGQEQYRSLGPVYYRGSAAAIIVFDITNLQSFENLDEWVKSLYSVCDKSTKIIFVGNKKDLLEERQVLFEQASVYASEHESSYIETSAKNGEGVSLLFTELINLLTSNIKNFESTQIITPQIDRKNENKSNCC